MRWAIVTGGSEREVAAYLPGNYRVAGTVDGGVLITGTDDGGWTLEDYVVPRLASGLMGCRETNNENRSV